MRALEVHFGAQEHTTAHHITRALRRTVPDVRVSGRGHRRIRPTSADVPLLWIESGNPSLPHVGDLSGRASAAWLIDTHRGLHWRADVARSFDVVFVAQRAALRPLAEDHGVAATWLPLAFPGDMYVAAEPSRDVDFVGNVVPGSRRDRIVSPIADRYRIPLGGYVPPAEMIERYSRARVVVNVPLACDLNMRAFEAVGAGAHLVTGPMDGLDELLAPELFTVVDSDDPDVWLRAVAAALDSDAGLGPRRRRAARAVLDHHTYEHRAGAILEGIASVIEPRRCPGDDLGRAAAALGLPGVALSAPLAPVRRAQLAGVAAAVAARRRAGAVSRVARRRFTS